MSGSGSEQPERYVFRRPCWPWAVAGVLFIGLAAAYTGTDLSEQAREAYGQQVLVATWFAAAGLGGLCWLVTAALLGEQVRLDSAAIEHVRLGRKDIRILWPEVELIALHKSRRRPKGAVEIRGPRGARILADPRVIAFDRLEQLIRERAATFGVETKDYR